MFDRMHAIRSLSAKAASGVVVAASLIVAACGSGASAGTGAIPSTSASLTSCSVTSAQLMSSANANGTAPPVPGASGKLAIDGSTALAPLFAAAAQEFQATNSGMQVAITPNGSGTGLKDVASGAVQIGLSDVFATEKLDAATAASLTDHQVAAVVFTLVTNTDLKGKVENLTSDQIKQLYTGQITNWSQIGGPNEAVTVINRPSTSGTRATFKKYVLNGTSESGGTELQQETTGAVLQAIKGTPGSIGYVSLSFVAQNPHDVSPICIDGAKAVASDVNSGRYTFWGIEHAYTKGAASGTAQTFLRYIVSDQVQKNDLLKLGYLPLTSVSSNAIQAHTMSGAAAPEQLQPLN